MKNLIWYLFAGTRGGETRVLIVTSLKKKPMNMNQLSKALNLDYKTVQHHIRILLDNQIITAINKGNYGAVYFISDELDKQWNDFQPIWKQFGKK
jgi:DNA-binding transcriptional ArsR family regulator